MSDTPSTPRTDVETWETISGAFKCTNKGKSTGLGGYVKSDFARQLERELIEIENDRNKWKECAADLASALNNEGLSIASERAFENFEKLNNSIK